MRFDDSAKQKNIEQEIKRVGKQLRELEHKELVLYEDKLSGTISEQTFSELIQANMFELKVAKKEQVRLLEQQTVYENELGNISSWIEKINSCNMVQEVDRELLEALIEKVEIGRYIQGENRRDITIFYKYIGALNVKE